MKQFFFTVFGGLFAILVGVGISYGGSIAWKASKPWLESQGIPISALLGQVPSKRPDGTTISGFSRTIRFTAYEEEDGSDTVNLPSGKMTAKSYIAINLNSGKVAEEYNSDQVLPIASLAKLVTAIVAKRSIDMDERISIDRSIMATYGNTAQFKPDEVFTASDLYYPLLMVSSNDAAEAFAQHFGRKKFIQYMNDFTQSIGAYRTYFADPSGISPLDISSAHDVAMVMDWLRKNDPELLAITGLKDYTIRSHTWTNPTHFLNLSEYIGGKNGYTPEADRTGISLFSVGNKKEIYAIVVLGSENRDGDVLNLLEKVKGR